MRAAWGWWMERRVEHEPTRFLPPRGSARDPLRKGSSAPQLRLTIGGFFRREPAHFRDFTARPHENAPSSRERSNNAPRRGPTPRLGHGEKKKTGGGTPGAGGVATDAADSTAWAEELTALQAIYEEDFAFDEREQRQYRIRVSPSSPSGDSSKAAVPWCSTSSGYPRRPPGIKLDADESRGVPNLANLESHLTTLAASSPRRAR